jgi:hypothetical protein
MTATLTTDRDFDVQILSDMIPGHFKRKNALMGSGLASSRAVIVNGTMPRTSVGLGTITVPRFGIIGEMSDNPEGSAVTPSALKSTNEQATPGRSSLAIEVTKWASLESEDANSDPYEEGLRQIEVSVMREMDRLSVAKAATTSLITDIYHATVPRYLDFDALADGYALWGDEEEDASALIVHSRVANGLRKLKDSDGKPLFITNMVDGRRVTKLGNTPVVISNRVPLTGSSMGTVTEAGAAVGGVGLTGTPTGLWNLRIRIIVGGARGTATFQFSTDGGRNYSATLTTAATVVLTDTAIDSKVGNNGGTGLTATFGVATYDVLSVYSSTTLAKATSLLVQPGALAFWYNAAAMRLLTDVDILKDNALAALHLYYVAHLYGRRPGSSYEGVVALQHNVQDFVG